MSAGGANPRASVVEEGEGVRLVQSTESNNDGGACAKCRWARSSLEQEPSRSRETVAWQDSQWKWLSVSVRM